MVKKSTRCTLYLCCLIFHATIFAYRIEAEEQRVKNRPNRCRLVGTEGFEPPRLSPWQSQSLLPYRLAMSQYFECFGIMNIPYLAKNDETKRFCRPFVYYNYYIIPKKCLQQNKPKIDSSDFGDIGGYYDYRILC